MQPSKFTFICLFFLTTSAVAQTPSPTPNYNQLERRLRNLEKKLDSNLISTEETNHNVRSFLDTKINLGGFFETGLTTVTESGRNTQLAGGSNTLGINIGAEFSDNLRFVTQVLTGITLPVENQHNDPRATAAGLPSRAEFRDFGTATLMTQGYLEWGSSEAFNIQAGMGYVPFGITLQQLELVLFVRRNGPQLLRTSDLVFPLWQGLHVHGVLPFRIPSRFGYDVYTFSPPSDAKMLGVGGRVWWKSPEENVNLGISSQVRKNNADTVKTLGLDAKVKFDHLTLTTEFAKNYSSINQPWTFYFEPDFDLHDQTFILYTFIDYLIDPLNKTGAGTLAIADPIEKWQYGTGVNWLPTSFTRLRAGVTFNQYVGQYANNLGQDRNYWSLDLSAGVAF